MPNLVSLNCSAFQILGKDFRTSDQFFTNKNCHNSRTSHDIDVKLGSVTKLDRKNTETSKKSDNDVMSPIGDIIVCFSIYGQFAAILYIINNNLLSYKTWKQKLKIFNIAFILLLWVKVLFLPKNVDFFEKNADISKIKEVLVLKDIFFWNYICVSLHTKFQVASIVLTSFRQVG